MPWMKPSSPSFADATGELRVNTHALPSQQLVIAVLGVALTLKCDNLESARKLPRA